MLELPQLTDADLPAAELLLGDSGAALLEGWLAESGGTVRAARARQVLYRPGSWISVVYLAEVEWSDHGGPVEERLVAVADSFGRQWGDAGQPVADDAAIRCWVYPDDPLLPSLRRLTDPAFASWLAEQSGLPGGKATTGTAAYRPGKRAVVELSAPAREQLVFRPGAGRVEAAVARPRVYGKVLRPGRAAGVRRRLDALADLLPVPECRFCSDELGLVVLEELPGETLDDALREPPRPLPDGEAIVDLLDRLATAELGGERASSIEAKARRQAALLRAVLPEHARRIERFAAALGDGGREPVTVAHNDFHPSQLLVDAKGAIAGLLDVDGVAPGRRGDDLATMLGRVWTAGRTASRGRGQAADYADHLFERFAAVVDPPELCRRTAGVVFGRATGPFRIQQRDWSSKALERIGLAEQWVAAAAAGEPPTPRPEAGA